MGAFNWDSKISKSAEEFVVLEAGDYDFTVVGLEREWYSGGERLPSCPMAVVKIRISSPKGDTTVSDKIRLCEELEWLISSFFECIGMKAKNEEVVMDWDHIIGKAGRCRVTKDEGKEPGKYFNNVAKWLAPAPKFGKFGK